MSFLGAPDVFFPEIRANVTQLLSAQASPRRLWGIDARSALGIRNIGGVSPHPSFLDQAYKGKQTLRVIAYRFIPFRAPPCSSSVMCPLLGRTQPLRERSTPNNI